MSGLRRHHHQRVHLVPVRGELELQRDQRELRRVLLEREQRAVELERELRFSPCEELHGENGEATRDAVGSKSFGAKPRRLPTPDRQTGISTDPRPQVSGSPKPARALKE